MLQVNNFSELAIGDRFTIPGERRPGSLVKVSPRFDGIYQWNAEERGTSIIGDRPYLVTVFVRPEEMVVKAD